MDINNLLFDSFYLLVVAIPVIVYLRRLKKRGGVGARVAGKRQDVLRRAEGPAPPYRPHLWHRLPEEAQEDSRLKKELARA